MREYLEDYCTGCGLCQSLGKAELYEDSKGFFHPESGDEEWLCKVCPAGGSQQNELDFNSVWGKSLKVYYGWSTDEKVRNKASSGGVLTELASFLLENNLVDAVMHTCMSDNNPTETMVCVSTTRNQLVERCGSRYAISHPLSKFDLLNGNSKYAFIGKPCDVTALKSYISLNPLLNDMFPYIFSFFCAGLPSKDSQSKLIQEMGVSGKMVNLKYRGDGWPGFATAIQDDGKVYTLDYDTSWGKILGRDVMKMCRFCLDGIGEMADISCCDAWYLTNELKPDFSENNGRNAIFCRSEKGRVLVEKAYKAGCINIEEFPDYIDKMKYIQTYQHDRRATMSAKIAAMKLMGRNTPDYKWSNITQYGKDASVKQKLSSFKGIVTRILKGKI